MVKENIKNYKIYKNENTELTLSAKAQRYLNVTDPIEIREYEQIMYRVFPEFCEKWGSECNCETLIDEHEIDRLSEGWNVSFGDLMEQVEKVPVYSYDVVGSDERYGMTAEECNEFLEALCDGMDEFERIQESISVLQDGKPNRYDLKIRYKNGEIDDYYTRLSGGKGWETDAERDEEALKEMRKIDPETFQDLDENHLEYWVEKLSPDSHVEKKI